MVEYVRNQIKKIRAQKGLNQTDIAIDLTLTAGAYSKIESGPVKLTVETLDKIARALDVNVIEFFPPTSTNNIENSQEKYGYASKTDIAELTLMIKQLKLEIASLKKDLAAKSTGKINKKK